MKEIPTVWSEKELPEPLEDEIGLIVLAAETRRLWKVEKHGPRLIWIGQDSLSKSETIFTVSYSRRVPVRIWFEWPVNLWAR